MKSPKEKTNDRIEKDERDLKRVKKITSDKPGQNEREYQERKREKFDSIFK